MPFGWFLNREGGFEVSSRSRVEVKALESSRSIHFRNVTFHFFGIAVELLDQIQACEKIGFIHGRENYIAALLFPVPPA